MESPEAQGNVTPACTSTMAESNAFRIEHRGRYWAVYDRDALVCITVYRKGAAEVVRRLQIRA